MHPQNFTAGTQEYSNIFLQRKKVGQFMICLPTSFEVGEVQRSQIAQSVFSSTKGVFIAPYSVTCGCGFEIRFVYSFSLSKS